MRRGSAPFLALAMLASAPAAAQLGLPPVGPVIGDVLDTTHRTLDPLQETVADVTRRAIRLADARLSRLSDLVRRNRETMELDVDGAPARRGELLLIGASETDIARAREAGASRVHWLTQDGNATARALYDKVADHPGFTQYRKVF